MTVRTLAIALPAALIALGLVATAASAGAPHGAAAHAITAHADAWGIEKTKVGYKKKRGYVAPKRKGRFSGFGFRGDGFRTSGQYK
ncbi:MAG: hypothetical protein AAF441_29260 [Pseudomonadota bacterium]